MIDPDFRYLETCGKVIAHSIRNLADSVILPYDMESYAMKMQIGMQTLRQGRKA